MFNNRIKAALVVLAASAGLAGCTSLGPYGGTSVGVSYGNGYGYGSPYGYGYGYGSPYGYNRYGYADPYSRYYSSYPYYGWYDGFYYPGSGYWVYDRYGNRTPWNTKQRSYWSGILQKIRERAAADGVNTTTAVPENWGAFGGQAATATTPQQRRSLNNIRRRIEAQRQLEAQAQGGANASVRSRAEVSEIRQQAQAERQQARAEQRAARIERQQAQQESVRERMLERRRARSEADE